MERTYHSALTMQGAENIRNDFVKLSAIVVGGLSIIIVGKIISQQIK